MFSTQISKRNFLLWIVLISIVAGRYTEIACLLLMIFVTVSQLKGLYVSQKWIVLGVCLFIHSIVMNIISGYSLFKFFQQFGLLLIMYIGYNQVYKYCHISLKNWFLKYVNLAFVLSILGLFQFVIAICTGLNIFPFTLDGYETQSSIRLHSILLEPGYFASVVAPAAAFVVLDKDYCKKYRLRSFIIIAAYILTLTTIAFVVLFIILFFKINQYIKWIKPVLISMFVCIGGWVITNLEDVSQENDNLPSQLQDIQLKVTQTLTVFENATPEDFELLNLSSYASLTNYWIAFHAPHRLLGTGLGSHESNYEKMYQSNFMHYGLNQTDAYSMFARLLSEFGWIGICIYFYFLYKYYNKNEVISLCLFVFFVSYLIRGGHYTIYGVAFFHFLYYQFGKQCEIRTK